MKEKHLIWSNYDLDPDSEEWRESYLEMCEANGIEPPGSDYDRWDYVTEMNDENLYFERENLNIQLSENIIVIAELGLWSGRRPGYRVIRSGNISSCLYFNYDYAEWWVDEKGDLRGMESHHDGTNAYLYRVWKPDLSETQKENFKGKILSGKATRQDINRYTSRLGDYIGDVYGWTFPHRKAIKT